MEDLKVGDKLFSESIYHGMREHFVVRLTPTQIVLSNQAKIKRPFQNGCSAIGTRGYGNTYYYLPNEELKNKWQRKVNNHFISCFGWKKATDEQTQKIVDFLKELN